MIFEVGKIYCLSEYKEYFLGMWATSFANEEREKLNGWAEKLKIDENELWKAEEPNDRIDIIVNHAKRYNVDIEDKLSYLEFYLPNKDSIVIALGTSGPKIACINEDTKNYEFPELEPISKEHEDYPFVLRHASARRLESNNTEDPRVKIYLNKKIEQMKKFLDGGCDSRKYPF